MTDTNTTTTRRAGRGSNGGRGASAARDGLSRGPVAALRGRLALALAAALVTALSGGVEARGGVALAPEAASEAQARQPLRYVRVREGGASVRNVADVQGISIGEVPGNGLLAVYGERAGWLEVDAPGGFAVWVFGRFLAPTPQAGVLEVTRNAVNMRPSPSTDIKDYPLTQQLQAGDRVTLIELLDPTAELSTTWARVWSPAGACGWVQTARTEPLPPGVDGRESWAQAEAAIAEKSRAGGTPASRPAVAAADAAANALAHARSVLETERAREVPDYAAARAAFERVLALEPSDAVRAQAEQALEMVAALEAKARTEAELAAEQQRRQQELAKRQERQWKEAAARDPDADRFDARGRIARVAGADGSAEFQLLRDDRVVAVVTCPSGRYDLRLFTGCDVGIVGEVALPEAATADAALPRIDAQRLEILAAR